MSKDRKFLYLMLAGLLVVLAGSIVFVAKYPREQIPQKWSEEQIRQMVRQECK